MAITALVIAVTGSLQGTEASPTSSACCEEPCAPQVCCAQSCGTFFAEGDLLYLRAFEGGLEICEPSEVSDHFNPDGSVISSFNANVRNPEFKWNPGFRVGLGYDFGDSDCGLGAYWLHYNSHLSGDKNHRNDHRNGRTGKIDFDVVDLLFGCEYDFSDCFALIPFGGLRGARIDQTLHSRFVDGFLGFDYAFREEGCFHEKFLGLGPVFGVEGDWKVGCGLSLYADLSVAFLYGTFHVNSNSIDAFDGGVNISHLSKRIQACQAVVDAGLGVRWKTCFCDNRFLVVKLGLEQHRYFNHNQFCGYGDLSLDGATLSVAIHY